MYSQVCDRVLKAWREGVFVGGSRLYVVYWPGGHSYVNRRRP